MNVTRLRYLADVLDKVGEEHPEHFDMSGWSKPVGDGWSVQPVVKDLLGIPYIKPVEPQHLAGVAPWECNTAACAAGYVPYTFGIPKPRGASWSEYASDVLGAEAGEERFALEQIFYGSPALFDSPLDQLTAAQVATALRAVADHYDDGEPDESF